MKNSEFISDPITFGRGKYIYIHTRIYIHIYTLTHICYICCYMLYITYICYNKANISHIIFSHQSPEIHNKILKQDINKHSILLIWIRWMISSKFNNCLWADNLSFPLYTDDSTDNWKPIFHLQKKSCNLREQCLLDLKHIF